MSCGVGRRCGSDLAWLWLWCRLAATAPIGALAWELPYATGAALKRQTTTTTTRPKNKQTKLQEETIRRVAIRGGGKEKLDEGGQKGKEYPIIK